MYFLSSSLPSSIALRTSQYFRAAANLSFFILCKPSGPFLAFFSIFWVFYLWTTMPFLGIGWHNLFAFFSVFGKFLSGESVREILTTNNKHSTTTPPQSGNPTARAARSPQLPGSRKKEKRTFFNPLLFSLSSLLFFFFASSSFRRGRGDLFP